MFSGFKSILDKATKSLEQIGDQIVSPLKRSGEVKLEQPSQKADQTLNTIEEDKPTQTPPTNTSKSFEWLPSLDFMPKMGETKSLSESGKSFFSLDTWIPNFEFSPPKAVELEESFGISLFSDVQVEEWMYRENYAAGSGILIKYTLYLSRLGQNNRALAQKAQITDNTFKTGVLYAMKANDEWEALRGLVGTIPKILNDINATQKYLDVLCIKIEELENQLSVQVNTTVSHQISLWKSQHEEELNQEREKSLKELVDLENQFIETEKRVEEEKRQQEIYRLRKENEDAIKSLEKTIDKQIGEYAIFGLVKPTEIENSNPSLEDIHLHHEDPSLDEFLGEEIEKREENEGNEQEDDTNVHVLVGEETPC